MTSSYGFVSIAGRLAVVAAPTASEYFRYVSIDATTTRASTVMRSMPTSDTRTHASMTIPLSRTRSRTSMRLVPPDVRSTGIVRLPSDYASPDPPAQYVEQPLSPPRAERLCVRGSEFVYEGPRSRRGGAAFPARDGDRISTNRVQLVLPCRSNRR